MDQRPCNVQILSALQAVVRLTTLAVAARHHRYWGSRLSVSPIRPQSCHRAPVDANKSKEEDEERRNYPAQNESPQHGRGLGKESSVGKNWVKEGVAQTPLQTINSNITLSPYDHLH